jgi:hypothetical protein
MKVDVGSGGYKRPGYIGLDILLPAEAAFDSNKLDVDVVCDIEHDRWPFDDNSVTHIFSSHCLEHVHNDRIAHIFTEMSRICVDGAEIEIWNPHAFHRDAFVISHINFLTEEIYHHVCGLQDFWHTAIGARWDLKEIRYHVLPATLQAAAKLGMSEDFAVTHLNHVIKEFGVFIEVNKTKPPRPHTPLRTIVDDVPPATMRETREVNRRPICTEAPIPEPAATGKAKRIDLEELRNELAQLRSESASWHATGKRFTKLTLARLRLV